MVYALRMFQSLIKKMCTLMKTMSVAYFTLSADYKTNQFRNTKRSERAWRRVVS